MSQNRKKTFIKAKLKGLFIYFQWPYSELLFSIKSVKISSMRGTIVGIESTQIKLTEDNYMINRLFSHMYFSTKDDDWRLRVLDFYLFHYHYHVSLMTYGRSVVTKLNLKTVSLNFWRTLSLEKSFPTAISQQKSLCKLWVTVWESTNISWTYCSRKRNNNTLIILAYVPVKFLGHILPVFDNSILACWSSVECIDHIIL